MFEKQKILSTQITESANKGISIISAFKIHDQPRRDIMRLGFCLLFSQTFSKDIPFYVYDGSTSPWDSGLKTELEQISAGHPMTYYSRPDLSMPERYLAGLREIKSDYFYMGFEDQPAMGLSDPFITAACTFLKSFSGLVDVVMIDGIKKFDINHEKKEVQISFKDLHSYPNGGRDNVGPIRVVNIDGYEFGIYRRSNYGFFLNALIAPKNDYARRLEWYLKHISRTSPQKIEMSTTGFLKRGPVYKYVAIPRQVFMLDIDFSSTEISTRSVRSRNYKKELFEAIVCNYQISIV